MRRFLFAGVIVLAASAMQSASAGSQDPHTIQGKCAKATGGHHVPGTRHRWQTYDIAAWNKCINDAALAEKRAMGFKN